MGEFFRRIFAWIFRDRKKQKETVIDDLSETIPLDDSIVVEEEIKIDESFIEEAINNFRTQINEGIIMPKYIAKRVIELDEETGLDKEIRAVNVIIDAESQRISVKLKEVLVSPTGIVMKVIKETQYDRYNTEQNKRYDNLEESPIGVGIKQLISLDLENYPNISE